MKNMKKKKSTRKKKLTKLEKKWIWPLATVLAILTAAIFGGLYLFSTNNSKNASAYQGAAASAGGGASPQSVRENNGINAQGGGNVQGDGATVEQPDFNNNGPSVYKPQAPVSIINNKVSMREPSKGLPFARYLAYITLHPDVLQLPPLELCFAPAFNEMADKALAALGNGDWVNAMHYAGVADENLKPDEMKYYMDFYEVPLADDFKRKLMQNTDIRIQAAWEAGDYPTMCKRLDDHAALVGTNDNPLFKAYSCVADSARHDMPFYVPSEDELRELRKRGVAFAYEYLNNLASWGVLDFLRYNVFSQRFETADYCGILGLKTDLEYAPRYFYSIKCLDNGAEVKSHEYVQQRVGFAGAKIEDVTSYKAQHLGIRTPLKTFLDFGAPPPLVDADNCDTLTWNVPYGVICGKEVGELVKVEASGFTYDYKGETREWTKTMTVPVPEPSATFLLLLGMAGLALKRRRE